MFAAAEAGGFSLFYSFDMSYFNTPTCADKIVGTYMTYVTSSSVPPLSPLHGRSAGRPTRVRLSA